MQDLLLASLQTYFLVSRCKGTSERAMVDNTGGDVYRAGLFAGLKGAEAARLVYRRSCIKVAKTSSKLSKSLRRISLQVDDWLHPVFAVCLAVGGARYQRMLGAKHWALCVTTFISSHLTSAP